LEDITPKNPKRQNLKPPGRCIFCEGVAGQDGVQMSGEHLWSDWISEKHLVPRSEDYVGGAEYVEFRSVFRRQQTNTITKFDRTRQGTAATRTIKVVCSSCNSGWMGTLETEAQPFLIPLIKGSSNFYVGTARQKITEWIVMKILVVEHLAYMGHPADPIFDQATRSEFMRSRKIPDGFRIWIAMQHGEKWITGFHRHATGLGIATTLPPPPEMNARPRNIQAVTWGIGRLLIYLNATSDPALYSHFEIDRLGPLHPFWPLDNSIVVWPPRFFVTDAFIDDLTEAFERFITSGGVIWPED
jgi:hypothetical protein